MCVRPSTASYGSFSLDMVRSPGFGSACTDLRPLQTWYPSGSLRFAVNLASTCNSPDRSTKSTRSRLNALPQFVNTGFQVLFHSPPGVLFTVPSQYYALSVTKEYSALRGGPRSFHQGSTCLDVLWILLLRYGFRVRGFHPLWLAFPKPFCYLSGNVCSPNPVVLAPRFGLRRFRSPLLTASMFLSFPPAT